jgi:hypothetical protein
MGPGDAAQLGRGREREGSGDLAAYRIVISWDIGITHPTERCDLPVGNYGAADEPIIGINDTIRVHIEETLQQDGLAVGQTGDLKGYLAGVSVADRAGRHAQTRGLGL